MNNIKALGWCLLLGFGSAYAESTTSEPLAVNVIGAPAFFGKSAEEIKKEDVVEQPNHSKSNQENSSKKEVKQGSGKDQESQAPEPTANNTNSEAKKDSGSSSATANQDQSKKQGEDDYIRGY